MVYLFIDEGKDGGSVFFVTWKYLEQFCLRFCLVLENKVIQKMGENVIDTQCTGKMPPCCDCSAPMGWNFNPKKVLKIHTNSIFASEIVIANLCKFHWL